jgi:nitrogen fixation-related uncharacterized protein
MTFGDTVAFFWAGRVYQFSDLTWSERTAQATP